MDWTIIEKITHHPAFLAGVSIITFFSLVFLLLSKTSWGKKQINKIKGQLSGVESKVTCAIKTIDSGLDEVNQTKQAFKDFKTEIKGDVKVVFSQIEYFEKNICEVIALIPNAKVQEKLNTFLAGWKEKKKEIQEYVGNSYTQYETELKELKEEKTHEIDALKGEIESLKEIVAQALNNKENTENGERKEGTNEETVEE